MSFIFSSDDTKLSFYFWYCQYYFTILHHAFWIAYFSLVRHTTPILPPSLWNDCPLTGNLNGDQNHRQMTGQVHNAMYCVQPTQCKPQSECTYAWVMCTLQCSVTIGWYINFCSEQTMLSSWGIPYCWSQFNQVFLFLIVVLLVKGWHRWQTLVKKQEQRGH